MSNSYIIELERLRTQLKNTLRSRFVPVTDEEQLSSLIPKVSRIGRWEQDDQTTPAYVSDGLIGLYDAVKNTRQGHKDGSLSAWQDLSGNDNDLSIAVNSGLEFKSDCLLAWKNASGIGVFSDVIVDDVKTAEIVVRAYDRTASYATFAAFNKSRNKMMCFVSSMSGIVFKTGGEGYAVNPYKRNTITADYNNQLFYIDGTEAVQNGTSDTFSATPANNFNLFRYSSSIGTGISGEICSVRLYNRSLTAQEIAQNFAIDQQRFGIETLTEVQTDAE